MLLWALLLTLTSQGARAGEPPELPSTPPWGRCPSPELQAQQWPRVTVTTPDWDDPVCTEGVSVTRGAPAEMTCNTSIPIYNVSICLRAPGRGGCQPIFTQATPGCYSRGGWKLCVQGCSAKMVTEGAWDIQAGQYVWTLSGRQTEQESTTLNVSEPPELPSTPPWGRCPSPELQAHQWPRVTVSTPDWDPVCTEGVSVTRGAPAEMTCNTSIPIRNVSICLRAPGQGGCQPIFTQATPGCYSRGGWKLCVQGCSAKMVTEGAQDIQAGQYVWTLSGRQTEQESTTLNVSVPLTPSTLRSAQDQPPGRLHVALILAPLLLCALALGGLQFWRRSRGRPSHVQFL